MALLNFAQQARAEINGLYLMQAAIFFTLTTRCANGFINIGVVTHLKPLCY